MDFKESLKNFSIRIKTIKDSISTEEATKTSIILPSFSLIGYDIFNPNEFVPEFVADVGIKKGEKVDYAIIIDNEPVILIEAKSINKSLEKHDSQLFRYFVSTKAKFAILTNGIIYRLYTDLDETNKMDREPFYEFNLLNITDDDIKEIQKFAKSEFDKDKIFENAAILKYSNIFKNVFTENCNNPSDELVRLFLKDNYKGVKTQNVVDKFKPVLRKAINDCIDEIVKERISALVTDTGYSTPEKTTPKSEPMDKELDALVIVKSLLNDIVDMNEITYKKTESYFAILLKNNTRKWITRIIMGDSQITLIIPDENKSEIRIKLDSINDIEKYKNELTDVLKRYIEPKPSDDKNINYVFTKWGNYPEPENYKVYLKYGIPESC